MSNGYRVTQLRITAFAPGEMCCEASALHELHNQKQVWSILQVQFRTNVQCTYQTFRPRTYNIYIYIMYNISKHCIVMWYHQSIALKLCWARPRRLWETFWTSWCFPVYKGHRVPERAMMVGCHGFNPASLKGAHQPSTPSICLVQ